MIKFQKVQLDNTTATIDFETSEITVGGVLVKVNEAEIENFRKLVLGGESEAATPASGTRAKAPKQAAKRGSPGGSKGVATKAEVQKALETVGKKGMTYAELRAACGGKQTSKATQEVGVETFGSGKGMARRLRLASAAA